MPVYKVDVQVNAYGEFITNSWHVLAAELAEASAMGLIIGNVSRNLLPEGVIIDAIRTSTPTPNDNAFYSTPVNLPGNRPNSADVLPPFCRYRIDFNIGPRRPLRKFMLWPFEPDTSGGAFTSAALTFVQQQFINLLLDAENLNICGPDGTPVISGACNPRVGMRQLRRGSKRKSPVI